jgi:hypothetical protein
MLFKLVYAIIYTISKPNIVQIAHGWRCQTEFSRKIDTFDTKQCYNIDTLQWYKYSSRRNIYALQNKIWYEPQLFNIIEGQYNPKCRILAAHSLGNHVILRLCENLKVYPEKVVMLDPAFLKGNSQLFYRCISIVKQLKDNGVDVTLIKSSNMTDRFRFFMHGYEEFINAGVNFKEINPPYKQSITQSHNYAITYFLQNWLINLQ